jgi:hypothetical protein
MAHLRRGVLAVLLALLTAIGAQAQTALQSTEFTPGSWTLILLPDTQMYSEQFPGLFMLQTRWIARNKDKYNIRYVLQLGDVTNSNTQREWERARDAIGELDGYVPYALASGNHDYGTQSARDTRLNEYFPLLKFKGWPSFGGAMNDDMCNTYHLFTAGGIDWIIIALEWAPRNETVQWANEVLAKYPQRKAILVTHAYLYHDGTRYDFTAKKESQGASPHSYFPNALVNDGEELWQKLVRRNNFAFTFNGHVSGQGVGFLSSKNDHGKTTHQMVVNYQMRKLGGEGYLRILEFLPDGKTVHATSYSPLYDRYLSEPGQQFSFELDP